MGFEDDVRSAVERAVKHCGSAKALSDLLGIQPSNITRWRGKSSPHVREVAPVMDYLNKVDEEECGGVALITLVQAQAGAGSSLVTEGEAVEVIPFARKMLSQTGCKEKNAVFMTVLGDSMQPILTDGDLILVDQSAREVQDGRIYVVGLGEELLVKRVLRTVNGVLLHSQNPDYPDVTVSKSEMEALRIVGRVVWCGHRF